MPDTPDGPAEPVAVTYCVPAVEGASSGPDKLTPTGSLSTFTYLVTVSDR